MRLIGEMLTCFFACVGVCSVVAYVFRLFDSRAICVYVTRKEAECEDPDAQEPEPGVCRYIIIGDSEARSRALDALADRYGRVYIMTDDTEQINGTGYPGGVSRDDRIHK